MHVCLYRIEINIVVIIIVVTCRFKTFGHFETAMAILIPLQGLETANYSNWSF